MYILWFESVGSASAIKSSLSRFHQQARADIQNLVKQALAADEIARDIDAESFAMHFTSTMFGLSYQWVVDADKMDVATALRRIKEHMLLILRPTTRGSKTIKI